MMDGGDDPAREYPCIIRVTDGEKAKFSTHVSQAIRSTSNPHRGVQVQPRELTKFHAAYSGLLKVSLSTLRKRDKKREKQRAELATRRKQRMAEPVVIKGAKRGSGRRKRQRLVKAAAKQEAAKERAAKKEEEKTKAR